MTSLHVICGLGPPNKNPGYAYVGEVACFGENRYDAYMKALLYNGFKLAPKDVLLSIGSYNVSVLKSYFVDLIEFNFV